MEEKNCLGIIMMMHTNLVLEKEKQKEKQRVLIRP